MPTFVRRALVALVTAAALPAAACAGTTQWTASATSRPGLVRLRIERSMPGSRNSNEDDVAVPGLDLSRDGEQRFILRREAGTLACSGIVRSRRGIGDCRFDADPRFTDHLERLGMTRPSENDNFNLAMVDAHAATATALARFGSRPSLGEFVALSVHRATPGWLSDLAAAGQRNIVPGELIAYRVHGVTGDWLRALIDADPALANASSGEIIALRIHGVTPEWLRGIADAGYRQVPADELIALRIHGISPEFARAAATMGRRPTPNDLVARKLRGRW